MSIANCKHLIEYKHPLDALKAMRKEFVFQQKYSQHTMTVFCNLCNNEQTELAWMQILRAIQLNNMEPNNDEFVYVGEHVAWNWQVAKVSYCDTVFHFAQ